VSYDALIIAQVAQSYRLLKAASAVLSRNVLGAIDPATGKSVSSSTLTCSTLCKLDSTSIKTLGYKFGDGLVQGGDIMASIPSKGLTFSPQPGDFLTVLNWPYVVIETRPEFAPGGSVCEWNLLVRK